MSGIESTILSTALERVVDSSVEGETVLTVTQFGEWAAIFLVGLVSASLGAVVAWTAYRGYTRNESSPMLYLATGVVFLTTIPFAISYGMDVFTTATDGQILLAITACHLLGLAAIVRSLGRP